MPAELLSTASAVFFRFWSALVATLFPSFRASWDFDALGLPDLVERTRLRVKVVRSEEGEVVFLPETFRAKSDFFLRVRSGFRNVEVALPAHLREDMGVLLRRSEELCGTEGRSRQSKRRTASKLEYARDGQLQLNVSSSRETTLPAVLLDSPVARTLCRQVRGTVRRQMRGLVQCSQ